MKMLEHKRVWLGAAAAAALMLGSARVAPMHADTSFNGSDAKIEVMLAVATKVYASPSMDAAPVGEQMDGTVVYAAESAMDATGTLWVRIVTLGDAELGWVPWSTVRISNVDWPHEAGEGSGAPGEPAAPISE